MSEIAADHFERYLEGPWEDYEYEPEPYYRPRKLQLLKPEDEFEDLATNEEVK